MAEPFTYVGAAAASTGTILKIIQQGFAYTEVPHDVRAFQHSIESFNGTLQTAKRLRRVKSHLMDDRDKHEIDQNIRRGTQILEHVSVAIEACRKDLSNKGTVGVRNRLLWLIRDHQTFISRTHTLGICHQSLNTDITGMRSLSDTARVVHPFHDATDFPKTLRPPNCRRVIPLSNQAAMAEQEKDDSYSLRPPRSRTPSISKLPDTKEEEVDFSWKSLPKLPESAYSEPVKSVEPRNSDASPQAPPKRRPVPPPKGPASPVQVREVEENFSWERMHPSKKQPEATEQEVNDKSSWMSPCINPDYCVDQKDIPDNISELPAEDVPIRYLPAMPRRKRISSLYSAPSMMSISSAMSDVTLVPSIDVPHSIESRFESSTLDVPTSRHRTQRAHSIDDLSTASTMTSPSILPRMTRLDSLDDGSIQQSDFVPRSTITSSIDETSYVPSPPKPRRTRRSAMIT